MPTLIGSSKSHNMGTYAPEDVELAPCRRETMPHSGRRAAGSPGTVARSRQELPCRVNEVERVQVILSSRQCLWRRKEVLNVSACSTLITQISCLSRHVFETWVAGKRVQQRTRKRQQQHHIPSGSA
jgi:hypothetical protein